MKVLLLGSGGREHALFTKISDSPKLKELHVFPGNGGFPPSNIIQNPSLSLDQLDSLSQFIKENSYDLVVVGPEQPLVDGITDILEGICPVFGPSQVAARLEASKDFSKIFMKKYNIPTAKSQTFTDYQEASQHVQNHYQKNLKEKTKAPPIVIKADGLAAGKGVTVASSWTEAEEAIEKAMKKGVFGKAGHTVLIEDFLLGQEISVFSFCDGERALPLLAVQDHKRAYDGDNGPNTGGMGAYLPVPIVTDALMEQIQTQILEPVMNGMKKEGSPYRGLLYAGLMVHNQYAKVVEFNVRFGDPETQALLALLEDDLLELLWQSAKGKLVPSSVQFRKGAAIVIVLAADGYPGSHYQKEIPLFDIIVDGGESDITLFHAGTTRKHGGLVSSGGRVFNLVATGKDLMEAREKAYTFMKRYSLSGLFYRKDIGMRAIG